MATSAFFAFLHFVAVFGIFATVFLEWQTMSPAPSLAERSGSSAAIAGTACSR
jgi:uncharacterized membrane protein